MEVLIFLLGALALVASYPYLRFVVKRLICAHKLVCICRKHDYKMHKTRYLWLFSGNRSKKCDCFVETPNEILAIKMFFVPRRLTVLVLKDNREYFIRSFASVVFAQFTLNGRTRKMPSYDFRYDSSTKTHRKILLVNPIPMEIRHRLRKNLEEVVSVGDVVGGIEIQSLTHLLDELEVKAK